MLTLIKYLLVPVLALLFVALLPVGLALSIFVDPLQLKRKKSPHSYFNPASTAKRPAL
ncbi:MULTISPECIES: hypothetical protein [Pseudomonas]|uniref:Uncharacterized protein n=1 Tax=Pseudomonas fluorescens TaxID=294 RepID=A0A944HBA2_PSEFL|nr:MULTISPECIES: hypothetical protein [Pseudomonas]WQG57766.1 hypothetical protein RHM66_23050 [Pseudomonas sp. RTB3]MBT2298080.1 hypothetical protein [Pseudomonas fluorescens]MBT2309797.1 hypothetical protein [Pseudomonas fluorescens]MBT2314960.1 hypothetical protein [Pseudomonas fluorescens]MBT2327866.1 hypothetical protein [Pseudomonas fluorescens]